MADMASLRSHVNRNVAGEQEDPFFHDPSSNENDYIGEPWFPELVVNQHFDPFSERNELLETDAALQDLAHRYPVPP